MKKTIFILFMLIICTFTVSCGAKTLENNLSNNSNKTATDDSTVANITELTQHSYNGITFSLNSRCIETEPNYFKDEQTGNDYVVSAYPATVKEITDKFLELLGEVRLENDFEGFEFAIVDSDYTEVITDSGDSYQYNIMTVRYKNGNGTHVAHVSSGNVLASISTSFQQKDQENNALIETERIIHSLKIDEQQVIKVMQESKSTEVTQTIGNEAMGYVTIPSTWIKFVDVDGGTDLQYSNAGGTDIITLNIFDDAGLTEEQKAKLDAESAASSVWYNLEQNDVTDITGARVTLGGFEAFQCYGMFISEDFGIESMIVCWIFEDESGVLHYISAEGPMMSVMEVVSYVENSFTMKAQE